MNKMNRKGIILAGGTGSRLFPLTKPMSKHLLPIYDKPMIYYPLSVLMLADIKNILIVCTQHELSRYQLLLEHADILGINLSFQIQNSPDGIIDCLSICSDFIEESYTSVILGDNFFYGQGFVDKLDNANHKDSESSIFSYQVKHPQHFGVLEFEDERKLIRIDEKPENPKSNWIATGLYFFDRTLLDKIKELKSSNSKNIEITDLLNLYIQEDRLNVEPLGRGFSWLDMGTPKDMLHASEFVRMIEERQGLKIACIEEIAFRKGFAKKSDLMKLIRSVSDSDYGRYVEKIINQ